MMEILQNDVHVAGRNATSLARGVSSLASTGTVIRDEHSRLSGNDKAKSAISASYDISKAIGQAIEQMSRNIRSVSSEFEAMDNQLGNQLNKLDQANSLEFSLNGRK
ncbi:TIGR04197 family type VII secretion effector [Streptococcus suis]